MERSSDRGPFEAGRTLPAKKLELFFDYTCPFAYVASTRARALAAEMGVELTYRPILLGGIFRAVGTPQNLMAELAPAKAAHNLADMHRWAERFGVTLRVPAAHPMRSVDALRATLATGIDPKVVDAIYRAYWAEGRDVASREVLAEILTAAGHDAERFLARAAEQETKDDLRRRTDEAASRGVFGVPTWIVDDEHLYWGQDRMHFVRGMRNEVDAREVAPTSRTIEWFWDFSSPFAYLSSTQIDAIARRTGAKIVSRPMLLGGLFRSVGTPTVPLATFSAAKQQHVASDLERWAAYWGVRYRFPSRFPMNTVRALRVWFALPEEKRAGYCRAVFDAYWADDRDIADDAVLASCVGDEAAAREALAKAGSDEVKAALRAATDGAAARGVFGAPTWIVDERDLYWGQDRIALVCDAVTSA